MAQENCPPPVETSLTDRAVLLHILAHVEENQETLTELLMQARKLDEYFEAFRPLLDSLRGNGQPDMLAVAQARRGIKRARRGT